MTTTAMSPPLPPTAVSEPKTLDELTTSSSSSEATTMEPMGPPPPKDPIAREPEPPQSHNEAQKEQSQSNSIELGVTSSKESSQESQRVAVPYTIPPWSGAPCHNFSFEVLKDGSIIDQFDVFEKGAYMFGRVDLCDFVLDHPTISRFHAVLQFKRSGDAYIYDLGSTHGTFVNKIQLEKKTYVDLHVGDVVRFGQSSRLYIFQGPSDLMPPEKDLKIIREAKFREQMLDQEASLRRAKHEASLAEGASWGMGEDAIEEAEDDGDEVTWQTYKGQLTEKQEKTREKVMKRLEKIAHMKKEIDAIRAKDISQGGLTQGQQTQIARNEQRMTQIMEELENLEETLNESIRESLGARSGNISHGKKKGATEDEEDVLSDEDEFYDRTKKKPFGKKAGENQSVETADTLLDKRDVIMKEMEDKKEMLLNEKNKMASENKEETEVGDALDAFMSGLSSQLVLDKTNQIQEEISTLQSELDRILYLLKIADPAGEAAKKRDLKIQEPKLNNSVPPAATVKKQPPKEPKKSSVSVKQASSSMQKENTEDAAVKSAKKPEASEIVHDATEGKTAVYVPIKPQWLGAVEKREAEQSHQQAVSSNVQESDEFVDYKDRKKILDSGESQVKVESGIESAAPGLIIRKRKQVDESQDKNNDPRQQVTSTPAVAEVMAMDAVALLLKHKKGVHASDEENVLESQDTSKKHKSSKDKKPKGPKRVLGPEKPSFLEDNSELETWVPPEGQSGDGRTSLNDRYGY
ncbi:hypothetical protein UlMin_014496 [Ulmus minor]